MRFCVAIDGPAASGKGTIARALARHFGFGHLDTGLLYRATGRRVLDGLTPVEAARALRPEDLSRDDLRTAEVGQAASRVAAVPEVRSALLDFQRAFAARDGGAVLDGRDIGTVICPDAEVKLFVTASDEIRARRRMEELAAASQIIAFDDMLADLRARDRRDAGRATAPMRAADDAVTLDTTEMDIATATDAAVAQVAQALTRR
ncbi:(d)CMP kinase [Rhodobacteraceae bacterium CCMM004]|nr:(d)CMP kinase [Rhodobacteraceae bacterium CCMM004]